MQVIKVDKYKLYYDYSDTYSPRLRLGQINDENDKPVMMSMYQEGNGIETKKNPFGSPGYTGVMVRIGDTKILVPYYLYFELEEGKNDHS